MNPSLAESTYWMLAGWTMLHFLWVGTLIGLLAGVGRLVLGCSRPTVRYTFALACLAAMTVAPAVIAAILLSQPLADPAQPAVMPTEFPTERVMVDLAPRVYMPPPTTASPHSVFMAQLMLRMNQAASELPWAWLFGAPLVFVMVATGMAGAERLRQHCCVVDEGPLPAMCHRLMASLCMAQRVAVGVCDRVASPVLIGILRPIILLPPAAVLGWSVEQLEMVLLHELAHVRRWDNLVNLLQRVVESLLFFHPVVWLVSRWVRREREHCCDEIVLSYTRQPRAYAEMLATMVVPLDANLALVAMGEANVVSRIRRVLRLQDEGMKLSHKVMALLMSGVIATAVLLGTSSRSSAAKPAEPVANSASPNAPTPSPAPVEASSVEYLPGPVVEAKDAVNVRLVDADGLPVEGASVGLHARYDNGVPVLYCMRDVPQRLVSDADGRVRLPWVWVEQSCRDVMPFIAMHLERQLLAIPLARSWHRTHELTVRMQPACHVRFGVNSSELTNLGHPLTAAKGHILVDGYDVVPVLQQFQVRPESRGEAYEFEYLLPPGKFQIYAYSDAEGHPETTHVFVPFEVKARQTNLDLGTIELPATRYSLYYGNLAPELVHVTEQGTGRQINLADYRGRVLLLCFAPLGCELNQLQGLADRYKQQGLAVLVIRPPGSRALTSKDVITEAVDSPGSSTTFDHGPSIKGNTAVNYGLQQSSTMLLIDREGRVVQRFRLERPGAQALLERELSARDVPSDLVSRRDFPRGQPRF